MTLQYDGHNVYTTANPLADSIADAERILSDLRAAADRLQTAIADERDAYGRLQDMREMYDGAEAEYMAEYAVDAATAKSGPLAGIPVSSDGYKFAVTSLRAKLRADLLADMWQDLDARRLQYEQAQSERQQAEADFSALKAMAALKTAVLQASTL